MACVPTIDRPCPLSAAEQGAIDGFCAHCDKQVHSLDGLDDAGRRALLAAATAPVCVSYRVARPLLRRAALGVAALGAGLGAGVAIADTGSSAPGFGSSGPTANLAGAAGLVQDDGLALDDLVFVGGVSRPDESQWQDDSELPELPVSYDDEE